MEHARQRDVVGVDAGAVRLGGSVRLGKAGVLAAIPRARCIRSPSELLQRVNFPTEGMRSKSWDEFAVPGAPPLDFVFTVCDNAAGEVCPYWPGQPMTAHWGIPDPAAVEGTDTEKWVAFRNAFRLLDNRIKIFTSLPLDSLDRIKLQERLDAIGKAD